MESRYAQKDLLQDTQVLDYWNRFIFEWDHDQYAQSFTFCVSLHWTKAKRTFWVKLVLNYLIADIYIYIIKPAELFYFKSIQPIETNKQCNSSHLHAAVIQAGFEAQLFP